jgi:hypothetical protein
MAYLSTTDASWQNRHRRQPEIDVSELVTPMEANRRAAAVNVLLRQIAHPSGVLTEWWNRTRYEQLGDRTPTQAWLAGDHEAVEQLVADWYTASEAAADRRRNDPEFMVVLRQKSAAFRTASVALGNIDALYA